MIVALGYYTAGIYLDRKLLFVGVLMALCYGATLFMRDWPWTFTFAGGVIAVSLLITAWVGRYAPPSRDAAGEAV